MENQMNEKPKLSDQRLDNKYGEKYPGANKEWGNIRVSVRI